MISQRRSPLTLHVMNDGNLYLWTWQGVIYTIVLPPYRKAFWCTRIRRSWGGEMGALSLRLDGTLKPGWRIMAGLRTYPHPPFWRNLPSYKSIIKPGVWKLSATVYRHYKQNVKILNRDHVQFKFTSVPAKNISRADGKKTRGIRSIDKSSKRI